MQDLGQLVQLESVPVPTGQYDRPWQRVAADLREKITAGRWQPGDRLPTVRDLAAQHGVAQNTILNAINQLRSEGLVSARRGGGVYVAEHPPTDVD